MQQLSDVPHLTASTHHNGIDNAMLNRDPCRADARLKACLAGMHTNKPHSISNPVSFPTLLRYYD